MAINQEQIDEIKTQWLLKENWQFNFYTPTLQKKVHSYGFVTRNWRYLR
jgi:5-(carboxyamino)imidazole ribonucleotide synthase